ncbi:MAG TPA: glycosyltransferase [Longimicrobium sp.]|jgi:glycosyltransferase involved in cell wall biosynthesis
MAPRVSVVVPSYNYAAYLGECLASIVGQRGFADFEVIVVDDGSTDGSREVIAGFADDPRFVVIAHETNRGHIRTMNDGFRRARGEYVIHVDADDFWHPDLLARVVAVLDAHPSVGLVHTGYRLVDGEGRVTSERATNIPYGDGWVGDALPFLLFENFIPPAAALFRRSALEEIGGELPEEIPYAEDWRMWMAIARRHEFAYVDASLASYRVHDRNLHSALLRSRAAEAVERRILDELFADDGLPPATRALRRRVLARHARRHADSYFGFGDRAECRRSLRRALRHAPGSALEPAFWKRYLAASIPQSVYRALQSVYRAG